MDGDSSESRDTPTPFLPQLAGSVTSTHSFDRSQPKRQRLSEEQDGDGSSSRAVAFGNSNVSGHARAQFGHQYFHGNVEQHFHDVVTSAPAEASPLGRILESLGFEQMGSRLTNVGRAQSKTCQWLLSKPEYQKWQDVDLLPEHHGFLWIKGKPAAGKSTAMRFLHDTARKQTRNRLVISFFFNARGEELEMSVEGMYRSLLYQLLETYPKLASVFPKPLNRPSRQVWSVDALKNRFFEAVLALDEVPLACYIDALDECNEDDVRDMVEFMQNLADAKLAEDQPFWVNFSSRHYPHITIRKGVEIILESQQEHDNDIAEYIQANLHLEETTTMEHIRSEIQARAAGVFLWVVLVVRILNKASDRGRNDLLHERLKDIPDGLNKLFEDILARGSLGQAELVSTIQWILFAHRPLRSDELYHAVLDTSQTGGKLSQAGSPGAMKRFVVDSSKGLAEITAGQRPKVQFIHESVKDYLIHGGGLVKLDPALQGNVLGLSHDQLKRRCEAYILAAQHQKALVDVYHAEHMSIPVRKAKTRRKQLLKQLPFLHYAVLGIIYHGDAAAAKGIGQGEFLHDFFLEIFICAHNLAEHYPVRHYNQSVDMPYILVDKDAMNLLQAELRQNPKKLANHGRYGSAIGAAMQNHNMLAIILLLQHSMQPDPRAFDDLEQVLGVAKTDSRRALRLFLDLRPGIDLGSLGDELLKYAFSDPALVPMLMRRGAKIRELPKIPDLPKDKDILSTSLFRAEIREVVSLDDLIDAYSAETWGAWLLIAVKADDYKVTDCLLTKGADCNADSGQGSCPLLHISIAQRFDHITQRLLVAGTDINLVGGTYSYPLGAAVAVGNQAIFEELLRRGAHVDMPEQHRHHKSALQIAISRGRWKMAAMLLEKGALVDIPESDYHLGSPLLNAVRERCEEIVAMLLERGALTDIYGAAQSDLDRFQYVGTTDSVSLLEVAIEKGNEKVLLMLLEAGAGDVERALRLATKKGNMRLVRILNSHNPEMRTGIHTAMLVCLRVACYTDTLDTLRRLLSGKVEKETVSRALTRACKSSPFKAIEVFLEHGADVNADQGDLKTPLQVACFNKRANLVELLIEKGADVNAQMNIGGALTTALTSGDVKSVKLLLKAGANVNVNPGDFKTPLQITCLAKRADLAEMLLEYGADVHAQADIGGALRSAAAAKDARSVLLLLQAGADVNAGNGVVMQSALTVGDERIIRILMEYGAKVT